MMTTAKGSTWEEHRRTKNTGSTLRSNLVLKDGRDHLPNYLVKEIKDLVRHNSKPASLSLPFDETRFAVMDLETTGFHHHMGDEIIAIGAVIIEDGQIKTEKTFHELVDPHCRVPDEIQALTGIHPEMLAGCPSFFGIIQSFLRFIDGSVLVGHHVDFDVGFINAKLKKYCRTQLNHHMLDTIALAQFLGIRSRGFSLDDLLVFYGIPSVGRHTALGDALMTAAVFMRLLAELRSRSVQTLLGLEIALKYHATFEEVGF
jgi:DNA polymerase-3 subunit epsilon